MRVFALDQASKITGWSLFENTTLLRYGIIDFGQDKLEEVEWDARILKLKIEVLKLIKKYKPELFICEDIQFQQNQKVYKLLAEILGVILNTFNEQEFLYEKISPSQWKGFCQIKGKARKEQKENTIKFVKEKFGNDVSEDEADAIGIGWYAVNNIVPKIKKKD